MTEFCNFYTYCTLFISFPIQIPWTFIKWYQMWYSTLSSKIIGKKKQLPYITQLFKEHFCFNTFHHIPRLEGDHSSLISKALQVVFAYPLEGSRYSGLESLVGGWRSSGACCEKSEIQKKEEVRHLLKMVVSFFLREGSCWFCWFRLLASQKYLVFWNW